jgi:hypothetical protein
VTASDPSSYVHPEPDQKDWTWTLSRRCPDCGLSAGEVDVSEVAERTEVAAAEWVQILMSSPAVSSRPAPDVWSALEYGAHVRDVLQIFDARLGQMLTSDEPTFANWNQDETALADNYSQQDPDQVAEELAQAAAQFVARIRAVTPDQLERRARRSDGAEFTVRTLLQYFLHDIIHHLWDVTGQQDGVDSLVAPG